MKTPPYFTDTFLQTALDRATLVIFDMNGLIIDDEQLQFESVNHALDGLGISIDESYWTNNCVGSRADEFLKIILQKHHMSDDASMISRLISSKNNRYHEIVSGQIIPLIRPGVTELITYLSEEVIKQMALATSAHPDEIETILGEHGLDLVHCFSVIVSGSDVERSKPDPEIYTKLSTISGHSAETCLVFEDSGIGVQSAVAAGMQCIAMPNRFTAAQDFSGAICCIDSLRKNAVKSTIIRR
jgi:HAD superfamily hydrolase (TIGR01509 family)